MDCAIVCLFPKENSYYDDIQVFQKGTIFQWFQVMSIQQTHRTPTSCEGALPEEERSRFGLLGYPAKHWIFQRLMMKEKFPGKIWFLGIARQPLIKHSLKSGANNVTVSW